MEGRIDRSAGTMCQACIRHVEPRRELAVAPAPKVDSHTEWTALVGAGCSTRTLPLTERASAWGVSAAGPQGVRGLNHPN